MSSWPKPFRAAKTVFREALSRTKFGLKRVLWANRRWVSHISGRSARKETLGIAAIIKEEGPYVLEWIAWHRCLGVSKFFIADHMSKDGTSELLAALHDKGIVIRIAWTKPPARDLQAVAYNYIADNFGKTVDWLAFVDVDEFFRPCASDLSPANSLQAWLEQMPARVGAVAVNWANYGSSNRIEPGEGLVTERFFLRSADSVPENRIVKSIVRMRFWKQVVGSAHVFAIKGASFYVNTLQSLLSPGEIRAHMTSGIVHGPFRLDHYIIKSRVEYFAKKAARGDVNADKKRYAEDFFVRFDRNDVSDPVSAEMLGLVKAEMERLRALLVDVPGNLGHLDRNLATLANYLDNPDRLRRDERQSRPHAALKVN